MQAERAGQREVGGCTRRVQTAGPVVGSWGPFLSFFFIFILFYFMEIGLCNSKGHKKIATYIGELILILDPVQRQDKTLHNSYVCI